MAMCFRALRYRLSKGRHFHASYDEFPQQSIDGKPESPWRWQLPLRLERKPLESIASKNGPNTGVDSSCWISWRSRWQY